MEQPSNSNKSNTSTLAIAVIISLVAVIFLYFSLSSLFTAKIEGIENKLTQEALPIILETEESEEFSHTFTIKEFNGKIGIYKDGDFQYQINVSVSTLPEADKKLLLRGIEVSTEQELNDIISCYY